MDNKNISCKHQYIVGYSYRMPQPFFRSLPCDRCGCKIKLSPSWKALYIFLSVFAWILAYIIAESVHIEIFGSTLLVSIVTFAVVFIVLSLIIDRLKRLILRFGKWIEEK